MPLLLLSRVSMPRILAPPAPMTAQLRSSGKTYNIGEAVLDREAMKARLTIDAERLPPGQHMLAIRVPQKTWNPNKRILITVE